MEKIRLVRKTFATYKPQEEMSDAEKEWFSREADYLKRDKEREKKDNIKSRILMGASLGTALGAEGLNYLTKMREDSGENRDLYNKIKSNALRDNKGLVIHDEENPLVVLNSSWKDQDNNAAWYGSDSARRSRFRYLKDARENGRDLGGARILDGSDTISIGKKLEGRSPLSLAHELGHRDASRFGKDKNSFVRKANFLRGSLTENTSLIDSSAFGLGLGTGYRSEVNRAQGKKEGWLSKSAAYLPIVAHAPTIISEYDANRRGLQKIREAGASKEAMNQARADAGASALSYTTRPLLTLAAGSFGRLYGKGLGRKKNRSIREKELAIIREENINHGNI